MAVFQRSLYGEDPSFTNLFRMLNDFENFSREVQGENRRQGRHAPRFNPKFDVRETERTYELHGELPGIERENLSIVFTEPQTVVISGRVERNYTSGTPPTGSLEGPQMSGAITEGGESHSHKASVSDEETEAAKEKGEVSKVDAAKRDEGKEAKARPQERFWHQERSIGEFQRTFTFNHRVDDSAVSASLNNGILHVSIPKASKPESRRIAIN